MKNATHIGSCQCCGRVQKLPSGLLSLHGYTKQWGFFSGTCRGSNYKPFEISKDLIERFIMESLRAIESLGEEKAALLKKPTPKTKAWYSVYCCDARGGSGRYEWQQGMVTKDTRTQQGGTVTVGLFWHGDKPEKWGYRGREEPNVERITSYNLKEDTPLYATAMLNARYVRDCIDPAIANHQKYIAWQRERIANWEPKSLTPVSTKVEEQKAADAEALVKAGCTRKPHGWAGTMFWFCPQGKWCLGRTAKAAVAELARIEKKDRADGKEKNDDDPK